ncbi:hypothetical protein MHU86_22067 [Fragilaria crotonensis]|nr:hypothetical protein MHU86_22067 [Fragilaria crotonensis]
MTGLGNDVGRLGTTANGDGSRNRNTMSGGLDSGNYRHTLAGNRPNSPHLMAQSEQKSLVETYTSCIQQYLAVHLLDNATFYAERLAATSPTNDSLYLLALCYYRQNQPQRTKFVLQQHQSKCDDSPDLLYLLATACHDLEDYSTGEEALLRRVRRDFRKTDCADINQYILTTSPCPIPNGAAGLHLLAKICAKSNRKQRAIQYYKMSLELDPLLWKSFEELCNLGVDDVDPTSVFGVDLIEHKQVNPMLPTMPVNNNTMNASTATASFLTPSLSHFNGREPNSQEASYNQAYQLQPCILLLTTSHVVWIG